MSKRVEGRISLRFENTTDALDAAWLLNTALTKLTQVEVLQCDLTVVEERES